MGYAVGPIRYQRVQTWIRRPRNRYRVIQLFCDLTAPISSDDRLGKKRVGPEDRRRSTGDVEKSPQNLYAFLAAGHVYRELGEFRNEMGEKSNLGLVVARQIGGREFLGQLHQSLVRTWFRFCVIFERRRDELCRSA